jgi:hypothetical protein
MIGTFGLLAIGLMYLALRGMTSPDWWSEQLPTWAFWLFNASIVLWLAPTALPVGVAQVPAAAEHGYAYARSLAFYHGRRRSAAGSHVDEAAVVPLEGDGHRGDRPIPVFGDDQVGFARTRRLTFVGIFTVQQDNDIAVLFDGS